MLIEFTGPSFVEREAHGHVWPAKAPKPRVVDITDAKVISDLLTTRGGERNRGGEFRIASSEPLLSLEGMGPKTAANLAVAGYVSQDDLAGLLVADQKTLAGTLGVDEQMVRGWVSTSKEAVKARAATAGNNIASGSVGAASASTDIPGPTGGTTTGGLANVTETPRQ